MSLLLSHSNAGPHIGYGSPLFNFVHLYGASISIGSVIPSGPATVVFKVPFLKSAAPCSTTEPAPAGPEGSDGTTKISAMQSTAIRAVTRDRAPRPPGPPVRPSVRWIDGERANSAFIPSTAFQHPVCGMLDHRSPHPFRRALPAQIPPCVDINLSANPPGPGGPGPPGPCARRESQGARGHFLTVGEVTFRYKTDA